MEKAEIGDIEQEYERILNTYDNNTLVMFLCNELSIEKKEQFVKEFHEE